MKLAENKLINLIVNYKKFIGLFAVILLFTTIRWLNINDISASRNIPIEADDAFSYIFHAKSLDMSKPKETKFFTSFRKLDEPMEPASKWDFYRKRFSHRIRRYYHLGHAIYLNALSKFTGTNYIETHWMSVKLLNMAFLVSLSCLAFTLGGLYAAIISGTLFLFTYLISPHHFTAAPREWVNLLYFTVILLYPLNLTVKKHSIIVIVLLPLMTLFHNLGKAACVLYIGYSLILAVDPKLRKKALITAGIGICSLIFTMLVFKVFGVTDESKETYGLHLVLTEGMTNLYTNFNPGLNLQGYYKFGLILVVTSLSLLYFMAKRNWKLVLTVCFTFGVFICLHFFAAEYKPVMDYYFLNEYFMTVALLEASLVGGLVFVSLCKELLKNFPERITKLISAAVIVMSVLFIVKTQISTANDSYKSYSIARQNYANPIPFFAKVESYLSPDDCVVFYNEYFLYSFFTFSKSDREVALVLDDGKVAPVNYSKTDYKSCRFLLSFDHSVDSWKVLYKEGEYVLYANPYSINK